MSLNLSFGLSWEKCPLATKELQQELKNCLFFSPQSVPALSRSVSCFKNFQKLFQLYLDCCLKETAPDIKTLMPFHMDGCNITHQVVPRICRNSLSLLQWFFKNLLCQVLSEPNYYCVFQSKWLQRLIGNKSTVILLISSWIFYITAGLQSSAFYFALRCNLKSANTKFLLMNFFMALSGIMFIYMFSGVSLVAPNLVANN